mmetsp:Transcript_14057/g.21035  ORF Transcript_14057/g.21035 Transcript_14057/m.21035 type:complete len:270 (-) Transcript_14057:2218-3027(-)
MYEGMKRRERGRLLPSSSKQEKALFIDVRSSPITIVSFTCVSISWGRTAPSELASFPFPSLLNSTRVRQVPSGDFENLIPIGPSLLISNLRVARFLSSILFINSISFVDKLAWGAGFSFGFKKNLIVFGLEGSRSASKMSTRSLFEQFEPFTETIVAPLKSSGSSSLSTVTFLAWLPLGKSTTLMKPLLSLSKRLIPSGTNSDQTRSISFALMSSTNATMSFLFTTSRLEMLSFVVFKIMSQFDDRIPFRFSSNHPLLVPSKSIITLTT